MKKSLVAFLVFVSAAAFGQTFKLPHPEGWGEELIPFPIEFAPGIAYQGEEHLRFTPGWGKPETEEFWSYCFLWWVDDKAVITKESLERDLKEYYSGLVGRNIESRKIDAKKIVPTTTSFKATKTGFEGAVNMLDYMEQKPIVLNVRIDLQDCSSEKKKAVFISVSPQSAAHAVWKQFGEIWRGFSCGG
jgi:hypothetical protein